MIVILSGAKRSRRICGCFFIDWAAQQKLSFKGFLFIVATKVALAYSGGLNTSNIIP
jgi:hypothetical protein